MLSSHCPARTAALLVLALSTACGPRRATPEPAFDQFATDQLATECRNAQVETDPSVIGTKAIGAITLRVYPVRASHRNLVSQLATGRVVAKIENLNAQDDYPPLALPAGGRGCWVLYWRARDNRLVSEFIAGSGTLRAVPLRTVIHVHQSNHPRARADFDRIHPADGSEPGRGVGLEVPLRASLFRLAALPAARATVAQGAGFVWVTCMTNGCCEAEF